MLSSLHSLFWVIYFAIDRAAAWLWVFIPCLSTVNNSFSPTLPFPFGNKTAHNGNSVPLSASLLPQPCPSFIADVFTRIVRSIVPTCCHPRCSQSLQPRFCPHCSNKMVLEKATTDRSSEPYRGMSGPDYHVKPVQTSQTLTSASVTPTAGLLGKKNILPLSLGGYQTE